MTARLLQSNTGRCYIALSPVRNSTPSDAAFGQSCLTACYFCGCTVVCSQELAAVTARELVDLDAVELTWSCLDDEDSQPTIYLVQSSSTTGRHHPTRRRLRAADADVDAVAWRIVAEVNWPGVWSYRVDTCR